MNPNRQFWEGRKVLLTGHTGFKGSWLSLWLQSLGAEVAGYALAPPTEPSLFVDAAVADGMRSVEADVRDLATFTALVDDFAPEVVLHLAAQPLVRYAYDNPVETYETNVMGTVNVLEAARSAESVRVVVCITTDKCYENREWVWGYRETEAMGGHDPYSSSKACAELVVSAYRRSFFHTEGAPAVASVRAGNVIGGGDWAVDRLIPDFFRSMAKGESIVVRNPAAIRPWQHVMEPLSGYLLLAERLWDDDVTRAQFADAWNFGPEDTDAKPVEWIVDRLISHWGDGASWEQDQREQPHEAQYLKLDISKAKTSLGYRPRLDLGTTLEWITEWYKAHDEGGDLRGLTLDQIARFEELDPT